ncbi:MAG: hypothetical protein HY911_02230 [Desulfobacterales bacterium]|nr:hypothetical protein [Desulfobacterales bacterium]
MKKTICVLFVILYIGCNYAYSWNDDTTHPHITEEAIKYSSFDTYLKRILFLRTGVMTTFGGKDLLKWVLDGAREEDTPLCRAGNHFHNPDFFAAKDWQDSGLSDTWWPYMTGWCAFGPFPNDKITSNLTWATGFADRSGRLDLIALEDNKWDWFDARKYFYTYLTGMDSHLQGSLIAPDEASRNTNFALALQALGQAMHLLQDTAVPAHVRDDFSQGHLMIVPGREWPHKWVGNDFEKYVQWHNDRWWFFGTAPVGSGFNQMQLTDLWDTDQLTFGYAPSGL